MHPYLQYLPLSIFFRHIKPNQIFDKIIKFNCKQFKFGNQNKKKLVIDLVIKYVNISIKSLMIYLKTYILYK